MKLQSMSAKYQIVVMIFALLILATIANLIIDGGAAAHDLLCTEHGSLWI